MEKMELINEIAGLTLNELNQLLNELSPSDDPDIEADLLWARCASDLELFALTYFPHYCVYAFNEFHTQMFTETRFGERAVRRANAAPRGYAKSTLKALIKPIHDVCYGLENFIVLISNTSSQAIGKLKDIRTEILTNTYLVRDYGLSFTRKNPGETSFEIKCGDHITKFEAYGAGVEMRGIRFGSFRPSKIVLDDCEHSEEVFNEALRQKLEDWYFQVASQIGNEHTNIEFVGTILHTDSLLSRLLTNPAYTTSIYRAVISWAENEALWSKWREIYTNLDNPNRLEESELFYKQNEVELLKGTKVLWPERQPYLYLMKEMVEKGRRNFMKEKQNSPIGGDDVLFDEMHWYRETDQGILIEKTGVTIPWTHLSKFAYGVMDPATGQSKAKRNKAGDYTCILTGYQDQKGRLFVQHDFTKRVAPTKYITELFELHDKFNYNKFAVETNLYRNLLLPNIAAEKKRREDERKSRGMQNFGIQLSFYDIVQTENKEKRIYTIEPKVTHGWILFNRTLSQEFKLQMESFPKGDHDDGPDALEMLWSLVNGRYKMGGLDMDAMGGR